MVRSGVRFFSLLMSSALLCSASTPAPRETGKGKDPDRLRGAGCDPLDSLFGQRSGLFREEGLQVEVVRTAGAVSPMALISGRYRFRYDVGFLANSGVGSEP